MAEWWEDDEKIHEESPFGIWWMGVRKNAKRTCPDWVASSMGFGAVGSFSTVSQAGETLGFGTSMSIIRGAGTKSEVGLAAITTGLVWCGGSYFGAIIDASYQMGHNGNHLGTDLADWFFDKKNAIENWWEHSHHWWNT